MPYDYIGLTRGLKLHIRRRNERGAAAVEFAIVLPLLVLLVFGIMEAGWMFAQQVEIRNAAREGARVAVVGETGSATTVCERADLSGSGAEVEVVIDSVNESVIVTVSNAYESLTGALDSIFGDVTLSSEVEMRAERPIDQLSGDSATCP
ncbi:MAG: TadE/TadG family type IV pilus assembly protein [Actinomycetota bacterium]